MTYRWVERPRKCRRCLSFAFTSVSFSLYAALVFFRRSRADELPMRCPIRFSADAVASPRGDSTWVFGTGSNTHGLKRWRHSVCEEHSGVEVSSGSCLWCVIRMFSFASRTYSSDVAYGGRETAELT